MDTLRNPNPQFIAITERETDTHLPLVEEHLGADFIVIEAEKDLPGQQMAYSFINGERVVKQNGIILNNVQSVWYRKPALIAPDGRPFNNEWERQASATTIDLFNNLLYAEFSDAKWMSDYYAMRRAGQKAHQLDVAHALGFNIPDTVITNDPWEAKEFVRGHPNSVIKSLVPTVAVEADGTNIAVPTTPIDPAKIRYEGLEHTPMIFQEAIKPAVELRVTVIGDQLFVAAIEDVDDPESGVRDYRLAYNEDRTRFFAFDELPQDEQGRCLTLIRKMELTYGAIDFIIDHSGKLWFLEINPGGQWQFVQEDTGLPIAQTIADELRTPLA